MTTYVVDPGLGRRRFSYTTKGNLDLLERYVRALGDLPGEWTTLTDIADVYKSIKRPNDPGLKTFRERVCMKYLVESVLYVQTRESVRAVIRVQVGGSATRTVEDGPDGGDGIRHVGKLQIYLWAADLHLNTPTSPSRTLSMRPRAYKTLARRWDAMTTLRDEKGKRFRLYRRIMGFSLSIVES